MPESRRFSYRLALRLGNQNPDAMLATMPYRIWLEWRLYDTVDPFGEWRADLRSATLAAIMVNLWGRKKGQPAVSPRQFMPQFEAVLGSGQPKREKTPDDLLEVVRRLNRSMGGDEIDLRAG